MIVWVSKERIGRPNDQRAEIWSINKNGIEVRMCGDDKVLKINQKDIIGVELGVDRLPKVGEIITGNYLVVAVHDNHIWVSELKADGNPVITNGQINLLKFTLAEVKNFMEVLPQKITIWRWMSQ